MSIMTVSSLFPPLKFNKVGLWSIWLSGLLLICFSYHATQLLSSIKVEIRKPRIFYQTSVRDKFSPSITLFSAPIPFNGSIRERESLAIKSWLRLSPYINVVLFGNDPSIQSFASAFGSRVRVESNIDFSFLNVPFFHSMVGRAEVSSSNISVIIHPESILFPDFISTLNLAYGLDHDWFLVASSKRASLFPFFLNKDGRQWLREDGKLISTRKLQDNLGQTWKWDFCEGRILMAWNNRDVPLHSGVLPPFLFGKGAHNHWLINEVYHSNYRFVFDASLTITNLHVLDHDDAKCISQSVTDWGYNGNFQLAEMYGLFSSHRVNFSDFVKLAKCGRQYMFTNKEKTVIYPPRYRTSNVLLKGKIMQFRRQRKISTCLASFGTLAWTIDYSLDREIDASMPLRIPYGLDSLLRIVANESKTVVLAIAGYSYKDMLMSWVCQLRRLMVNNFLVCALDDETYEFSLLQGIPVFRDSLAPKNISFNDCHFGTKCFQKVTKTKSRLVLQILKMGYNVLLSDVDVYWFKNPIPFLKTFGPSVLVAQSDEYNLTVPINLPRRLNSGFYYARSDNPTIAALEKVVIHAMNSDLSEQPSFYDTLCGQGGSNRVGNDKCLEPQTNLTVQFLNRTLFPNGAFQSLWEEMNVREACESKGCYVLHNNWISGRIKKLERQIHSGLWEYDVSSRMCLQRWHDRKVLKFT